MNRPRNSGPRPGRKAGRGTAGRALAENPYGLSTREVRAEIRRCAARGWQLWEIRRRFTRRGQP